MKIRMKCDHAFRDGDKVVDAKEGDELDVTQRAGCRLQSEGAADILEHDAPKPRAKASKLVETAQSKAVQAQLKKED